MILDNSHISKSHEITILDDSCAKDAELLKSELEYLSNNAPQKP